MEIYDFEIRRWTKEFDNIRKVLQTSANFVRWYTPTKRILNLLLPVRDGYFLCTFILKFEHREKPTFFLGYYKTNGCYDALDFSHKGFCCQREDDEGDEDVEKIFLQLAKSTKEAHYIKASRKLAKVFIDNVYSTEIKRLITLPLPK